MSENNEFTFENEQYRKTYWHTCSHVLAQAVKRLHPEVKLAIGPAIDNGFYYDFDAPFTFTPEMLAELEAEMRKICKEKLKLERFELPRDEAIKFMEEKEEPYKVELIQDLPEDAHISFYRQGEFTDLCAGPHLDSTGRIKGNAIKLTQCCGAYWRGDSKRKMLQRIYAVAFPKKEDLDAYLAEQEEALKRDHNKLGRELEYFTTVDCIGQGLPVLLPKGARVVQLLVAEVERNVDGNLNKVHHIEEPAEIEHEVVTAALRKQDALADDTEDIADEQEHLEKEALALRSSGHPGLADGNRPGNAEAQDHQSFQKVSVIHGSPLLFLSKITLFCGSPAATWAKRRRYGYRPAPLPSQSR